MADNSRAINRIFTRSVMDDLIKKGSNETFDYVVRRYLSDPAGKNNGELISEIYTCLDHHNRNEYYYMNTLLNKLLCGIHNVNTTTALSQLRVGKSIADFVMINGEGKVYEIKSDLDNFTRLHGQVQDYYRAFSKVSVLTSIHELEKVHEVLRDFGDMGAAVGIYVLSEDNSIFSRERSREPKEYDSLLSHECLFKMMRKSEYENVIQKWFGTKVTVEPVFYFKENLKLFCDIPIKQAQSMTFAELKKRNRIAAEKLEKVQPELKALCYFSNWEKRIPELEHMLKKEYSGR